MEKDGQGVAGTESTGMAGGSRAPVIRFVLVFLVATAAFLTLFELWLTRTGFFQTYLEICAAVSGRVIDVLSSGVIVEGSSLRSTAPGSSPIEVRKGCDAIQPAAILLAGILAFPSPVSRRLWGILVGTAILQVLNIVRIVSLYYISVHYPDAFHLMHVDVWQVGFIFVALLLWMVWLRWAVPARA